MSTRIGSGRPEPSLGRAAAIALSPMALNHRLPRDRRPHPPHRTARLTLIGRNVMSSELLPTRSHDARPGGAVPNCITDVRQGIPRRTVRGQLLLDQPDDPVVVPATAV